MEETIKITLAGSYSKKSSDQTSSLGVGLHANKNTLPEDSIMEELSLDSLFRQERFDSDNFRVIIELCPVISNPLFNPVTEVVKKDGDNIKILNFGPDASVNGAVEKGNGFEWTEYEAVRDTQLSNDECGYTYFCGKDIFNNHILRSTTHKSVAKSNNGPSENFNTIDDTLRNIYGEVLEHDDTLQSYYPDQYPTDRTAHLYSVDDIYTFNEAIANRLEERNGWFGFVNRAKMPVWPASGEPYDIYKVINSEPSAKYITMYPGSDELSLIPSYNKLTDRTESNWNYCLTYPSSSTTEGISFIAEDGSIVLAVFEQDENSRTMRCVSYPKHGLVDGDVVNVYVNGIMEYQSVVVTIEDDYTFTAPLEMSYTISADTGDTETVVSFKKVVDGIENQYYVRVFSRLPNFRFADKAVTSENLYGEGSDMIERYQTLDNEFEKHISSMGFAQTIFADKTCQIVFTDDIDVSCLKDNLGRPLTEIYLTAVKNNRGHEVWYSGQGSVSVSDVERSSCFGKLTCGFWLTDGEDESEMSNAKRLTNIGENAVSGLNVTALNGTGESDDAIVYEEDTHYYGDFCSYSPAEDYEESIQPILFRFNTAQRECTSITTVSYDEIIRDDFMMTPPSMEGKIDNGDYNNVTPFITKKFEEDTSEMTSEGYYYEPHFKIPLKEFSVEKSYGEPFIYNCMSITEETGGTFLVYTEDYNYADKGENVIFFDKEQYVAYPAKVVDIINNKKFICEAENGIVTGETVPNMVLVRRPEDIPMYANFLTDGSCEFSWRDIHNCGTDLANEYEEYPFSNGRHYVTKKFNLFLRRQDPYGENNLYDPENTSVFNSPYGVVGKQTAYDDVYTKEKDSEC